MHQRHDDRWPEIPVSALDIIIELQLLTVSQNEAILAELQKRASKLSPENQAKVNAISDVVAGINRKIDAAQQS